MYDDSSLPPKESNRPPVCIKIDNRKGHQVTEAGDKDRKELESALKARSGSSKDGSPNKKCKKSSADLPKFPSHEEEKQQQEIEQQQEEKEEEVSSEEYGVEENVEEYYGVSVKTQDLWLASFIAACEYYEQNGNCVVPPNYEVQSKHDQYELIALGRWVQRQRNFRDKGAIKPDRLELLDQLVQDGKFMWSMPPLKPTGDTLWDSQALCLWEYEKTNGHCNVGAGHLAYLVKDSQDSNDQEEPTFGLGKWLSEQRALKAKGTLAPERLALLQACVDNGKMHW
jgi:hypothetical protein